MILRKFLESIIETLWCTTAPWSSFLLIIKNCNVHETTVFWNLHANNPSIIDKPRSVWWEITSTSKVLVSCLANSIMPSSHADSVHYMTWQKQRHIHYNVVFISFIKNYQHCTFTRYGQALKYIDASTTSRNTLGFYLNLCSLSKPYKPTQTLVMLGLRLVKHKKCFKSQVFRHV